MQIIRSYPFKDAFDHQFLKGDVRELLILTNGDHKGEIKGNKIYRFF